MIAEQIAVTTFADIRLWAGRWCCRWCRAKAFRICDIEHAPWCKVVARAEAVV